MRAALLAVFWLGLATRAIAGDSRFKIIVNPENPATAVDRDLLRDIFLKKATTWSDGNTVRPIDLSTKFPVRERFTEDVLKKTPSQLKTYWNQQIFSGKGVPPPEVDSPAQMIAYVLATPGAVGYVPADVDARAAKVVQVK